MIDVDLDRHTIFVTLAGSHAHGTARDGSDVDVRGVCIAPLAARVGLTRRFEQFEGTLGGALWQAIVPRIAAHPTAAAALAVKTEAVIYDVGKFLGLCSTGNPNALEILFADPRDWLWHTPSWTRIHDARASFLSRQVEHTYAGYAMAQLRKIETHRAWLLHPPARAPTRAEFGLPDTGTLGREDRDRIEQAVADRIRGWGIDDLELGKGERIAIAERMLAFWTDVLQVGDEALPEATTALATAALRLPPELAATLAAERRYRAAMRHWDAYAAWARGRNPVRAALERRHGYDTKHAMHLVRLMLTGIELLEQGELRVRRSDADELIAIREGALAFDELRARATSLRARMAAAATVSRLPERVDIVPIDAMLLELVRGAM